MRRLALLPLLLSLSAAPAAASEAERYRLGQEIQRLAERSAWRGVERVYAELTKLGPPSARHHLLAYQAARSRGEIDLAWERLALALAAPSDDPTLAAARKEHEALTARFGRLSVEVVPPRLAVLVAYEAPFAPEERNALDRARAELVAKRRFDGLVPVGRYMVDGEIFEVVPHGEPIVLRVVPPDSGPTAAAPSTDAPEADQLPPSR